MQTIDTFEGLDIALAALRAEKRRIALVPTMGALHLGHLALVDLARQHADAVIVSIFVNPTQFGPNEDFDAYPRTFAQDQAKLSAASVDLLWAPDSLLMYPAGFASTVTVSGLADRLCGAERPGHFDGVATVVTKLFAQIRPDVAVFGEKDWQQLAIIRRVTADLNLGVDVIGAPIVREADGLAISSRNVYLSEAERAIAVHFPSTLQAVRRAIINGDDVATVLENGRAALLAAGVDRVDYLELIDGPSLAPLTMPAPQGRILGAVRIGRTRLIDNIALGDV